jgi:hypothetical protein
MHRVAALVEAWHHQQRSGAVARVIATEGLGPQHRDELLLVDGDGHAGGSLLTQIAMVLVGVAAVEDAQKGAVMPFVQINIPAGALDTDHKRDMIAKVTNALVAADRVSFTAVARMEP